MQSPTSRVAKTLHDEHMATLDCLATLQSELVRHRPNQVPDVSDPGFAAALSRTRALLNSELGSHFEFEEKVIFPLLEDAGEAGIVMLLTEEHETILPIGRRLSELAERVRVEGESGTTWKELRLLGLELCERLSSHVEKEEMGLLPMIDSIMDEDQDMALCDQYLLER